jgi:hypothetical protein
MLRSSMGTTNVTVGDDDRRLLIAHYHFYRDMDTGRRSPMTPPQQHFVAVCRGSVPPETEHERAYMRFKQLIALASVDEAAVVAAGFVLPPFNPKSEVSVESQLVDVPCPALCGLRPTDLTRATDRDSSGDPMHAVSAAD